MAKTDPTARAVHDDECLREIAMRLDGLPSRSRALRQAFERDEIRGEPLDPDWVEDTVRRVVAKDNSPTRSIASVAVTLALLVCVGLGVAFRDVVFSQPWRVDPRGVQDYVEANGGALSADSVGGADETGDSAEDSSLALIRTYNSPDEFESILVLHAIKLHQCCDIALLLERKRGGDPAATSRSLLAAIEAIAGGDASASDSIADQLGEKWARVWRHSARYMGDAAADPRLSRHVGAALTRVRERLAREQG